MAILHVVKKNHYQDSMKLMQISQKLSGVSGVKNAAAMMATEANLAMMKDAGLLDDMPEATANDLIVAVKADTKEKAEEAAAMLDSLLAPPDAGAALAKKYKSLGSAYGALPGANLVAVSLPGKFAKLEVGKAIDTGLHTFLFSDNLTIDEEIELKERARERGLLVMGPGCGTAILNGVGLGFANVLDRGPVGMIAASGTGLQEVSCLINNSGVGISHAIGVGGRDLSEDVGGIMTLEALKLLESDEATELLVLISKPPSKNVAEKIISAIESAGKPAVVCFLGSDVSHGNGKTVFSSTLEDAAIGAVKIAGGDLGSIQGGDGWKKSADRLVKSLDPGQKYLRGLFSGGTLCYEAQKVLEPILGGVYSNAPLNKEYKLKDSGKSTRHTCLDLGEEEFTVGRPHPMIDAQLRNERLVREASRAEVGVILLDIVLGYVASPDPAGDILPAIKEAKKAAAKKGWKLAFVAHVCGTAKDPQGLREQEEKLESEGVLVFPTNALASRVAGYIASRGKTPAVKRNKGEKI